MKLLNRSTLLMPVILLLSIAGLACGQSAYEYGPNSQRQEEFLRERSLSTVGKIVMSFRALNEIIGFMFQHNTMPASPRVSWYSMMVEGMFETMVTLEFRLFSTT